MALNGKGWFIWQVSRCEGGSPAAIAERAVQSGVTHVLLKIAERTHAFGIDYAGRDLIGPVAEALRERGLQVWGWHFVYGQQPVDEAEIAIQRVNQLRLDGYVIDAEADYKRPGKAAAARSFMATLRAGLARETLVALSSYRYPSLHPQLPWRAFLEACDLCMPQVYWEQAHNSAAQLARSVAELSNPDLVGCVRPVVPTGAAYGTGNWRATPADLNGFLKEALRLKLPAANFYSWDYAAAEGNTALWEAVADFDWAAGEAEVETSRVIETYFQALNDHDQARILDLYQPNAGHVTVERTRSGREQLAEWYAEFLGRELPGATFTLQAMTARRNSRYVRWSATGPTAQVLDGDDTFGVLDGRIQYHSTHYSLLQTVPIETVMVR